MITEQLYSLREAGNQKSLFFSGQSTKRVGLNGCPLRKKNIFKFLKNFFFIFFYFFFKWTVHYFFSFRLSLTNQDINRRFFEIYKYEAFVPHKQLWKVLYVIDLFVPLYLWQNFPQWNKILEIHKPGDGGHKPTS